MLEQLQYYVDNISTLDIVVILAVLFISGCVAMAADDFFNTRRGRCGRQFFNGGDEVE